MNTNILEPRVSGSVDPVLADLVERLTARLHAGEQVDDEAVLAEHPEHAERLRGLLPALRLVAGLSDAGREAVGDSIQEPLAGTLGDFRLLREVGRGGMGVVYEAQQLSLRRRVALKVLPLASTLDPRQLQRFHNEAQAAACLHHTNIVPVYSVGCERGVHYYAMQFIEGTNLASLISRLRGQPGGEVVAPQPVKTVDAAAGEPVEPAPTGVDTPPMAHRSTERPAKSQEHYRTVARLGIQAADALDHAHQHGIIHRDVKPANLMVDSAGQLWITDFGLAQMQSDTRLTMTGDLVGTLRYMSPEQALAKRVVVDHRTDVYSLGATLYELLTLQAAFTGSDRQELLRQIAFEEPKALRRVNRAIPAELETIVLKALEKNPAERYATSQEVGDDLRRWLEDKPIQARRPSLFQVARKWARRHQPAVAASALCLLVTLVVLGGSVGWALSVRASRQNNVREALLAAEPGLRKGNPWDPALIAAVERAEAQLGGGALGAVLRERVHQLRRDQQMLVRLEDAGLQAAASSKETHADYAGADKLFAEAFADYGLDVAAMDTTEAVEGIRASAICRHLVAALDDWADVRGKSMPGNKTLLQQLAELADDDPWTRQLRDKVRRGDRAALERLAQEAEPSQLPANLHRLGNALIDAGSVAEAAAVLSRAQREYPGDFWLNHSLGLALALRDHKADFWMDQGALTYTYKEMPGRAQAVRFDQAAVALRPLSPAAYVNLGTDLLELRKSAEAEAAFRKAIQLHPGLATAHVDLGLALSHQGKLTEAITSFMNAIRLKPSHSMAHNNLGTILAAQRKPAEAEKAFREATRLNPRRATAYNNLGSALLDQHKLKEAEAAHRKAIELNPGYAYAYDGLGKTLQQQGKSVAAEAAHHEAIRLRPNLADFHLNLGIALFDQGKWAAAEGACREAIRLEPRSAKAYNTLGNALREKGDVKGAIRELLTAIKIDGKLAAAHSNLGNALRDNGDREGAIREYQKAIELDGNYAMAHNNLGVALKEKGDREGAIREWQIAIKIDPKSALAHNNLGVALDEKGDHKGAIREYHAAIEIDGKFAAGHANLGAALLDEGDLDGAIREFRAAIESNPKDAHLRYNLANILRMKGDLDRAIRAFRAAIKTDPNYAEAHCDLGSALVAQGHFADGLAVLKKGHELGSKNPAWPYPSAQWIRTTERLIALDSKLPKVLQGTAKVAGAAEQLELAGLCQTYKKLYVSAARFYAQAFAAEPKLADNLDTQNRYNAACAAALAGCGQGKDADKLDGKERARLRQQSLAWLRNDLEVYRRLMDKPTDKAGPAIERQMRHWLKDEDFAGVRAAESLARLPKEERKEWQKLWSEVEALRQRVAPPAKKDKPL